MQIAGDRRKGARRLAPLEVWKIQGGSPDKWDQLRADGWDEGKLMQEAAKACPPCSATALLSGALEAVAQAATEGKAGGCIDPDDAAAWNAVLRWLRAWKCQPDNPARALEASQDNPVMSSNLAVYGSLGLRGPAPSAKKPGGTKPNHGAIRFQIQEDEPPRGPDMKPNPEETFTQPKSSLDKTNALKRVRTSQSGRGTLGRSNWCSRSRLARVGKP